MAGIRKPFQGVGNIIRFNWHFYVLSVVVVMVLIVLSFFLQPPFTTFAAIATALVILPTFVSLAVSWYVYDVSALYSLNWLNCYHFKVAGLMININAGFDETSALLADKYPDSSLIVYDFYDAKKHTEVSIERARKAYPAYPNTISITTEHLPISNDAVDVIFLLFAAHEIRNDIERLVFFKELYRILSPNGSIVITEHLRNLPNFLAYTIGFLHFLPKPIWLQGFKQAGFYIKGETKITPFITTFLLTKNGNTS